MSKYKHTLVKHFLYTPTGSHLALIKSLSVRIMTNKVCAWVIHLLQRKMLKHKNRRRITCAGATRHRNTSSLFCVTVLRHRGLPTQINKVAERGSNKLCRPVQLDLVLICKMHSQFRVTVGHCSIYTGLFNECLSSLRK